jgi:drug/metabolite transporter (DMT)-like permease
MRAHVADAQNRQERKAEFLLLVVVIIWAANYPVIKYGIGELSPFVFNAVRYVAAAAVLGAILFRRSEWQPIASGDWGRLFRAGVVANVIYQIAFIIGISLTTAGNAAILLNTSPLWTLFLSARIHKEKVERRMWLGMLVSVIGVALIIFGSGKRLSMGGTALYGDLITIGAAALWGLNNNLQKPLLARYPTLQVTYVMITIGAIGLALVAVPSTLAKEWSSSHWIPLAVAALSGAISIGIANLFWSMGVKYLGPGRTAIFNNLIPILAFLVSAFTLNEDVTAMHFVGAAVTIAGVWYARH